MLRVQRQSLCALGTLRAVRLWLVQRSLVSARCLLSAAVPLCRGASLCLLRRVESVHVKFRVQSWPFASSVNGGVVALYSRELFASHSDKLQAASPL